MRRTRAQFEDAERRDLSPPAFMSEESCGHRRTQNDDPHRSAWMRDRVSHSGAFRRLQHTTPVVVNLTGDNSRTCMTFTLNIAQMTRSVGRAPRLRKTFVVTVALTHGWCHPPFDHSGEYERNE